jgi:hypothetical protein
MTVDRDTNDEARLVDLVFISTILQDGFHQIDMSSTSNAIGCLLKIGHSEQIEANVKL